MSTVASSTRRTVAYDPVGWWVYLALLAGCAFALGPFLILISTAFKTDTQIYSGSAWELPAPVTFEHFHSAIERDVLGRLLFTFLVAAVMTAGQVIFSSLAAYAFARLRFPGRDLLFWSYLSTLMIPNVVTVIPLFVLVQRLGLSDSFAAIVLPYVLGTPFGVFLLRQYFLTLPKDLEAAASLDGAGPFRTYLTVIMPLSRPIVSTLALMTFVFGWNNYLWPLIASNSESTRVLTVMIAALNSNYVTDVGTMMAISLIATAPLLIVFLVFQKQIVRSIALSGFK